MKKNLFLALACIASLNSALIRAESEVEKTEKVTKVDVHPCVKFGEEPDPKAIAAMFILATSKLPVPAAIMSMFLPLIQTVTNYEVKEMNKTAISNPDQQSRAHIVRMLNSGWTPVVWTLSVLGISPLFFGHLPDTDNEKNKVAALTIFGYALMQAYASYEARKITKENAVHATL